MKCCIENKYCLGVAITTKCDGFFVFKLKKDALLLERPVNNIKHINYITIHIPVAYLFHLELSLNHNFWQTQLTPGSSCC